MQDQMRPGCGNVSQNTKIVRYESYITLRPNQFPLLQYSSIGILSNDDPNFEYELRPRS
jgi:hypothetical protein